MPVAVLSKAQSCVLSLAWFEGSNPYKGMDIHFFDIHLLCLLFVVRVQASAKLISSLW
jgi:hypothetical protein